MKRFILAGLICFAANPAFAWLQDGHSIIAEIAQRRLARDAPAIASKVQNILGPGVSMASIASWADDYKWQNKATQRWHFVLIPIAEDDYDPSKECVVDPKEGGDCIIAELDRLKSEVRCTKDMDDQKKALMLAVHFVGDVHQPLHTVQENHGGTEIKVQVSMRGAVCPVCAITPVPDDLNDAWAHTLINKTVWNWGNYVTRLENGWLKDHDGSGVDGGGPVQWALETHKVAQKIWKLTPENKILDDDYYNRVLPLLDQQLGLASLRLTRFLEDALGSDECPATSP